MAKQASKKKRVNRKLKRTIRKTLSAVFMITALIVAAIPVQNNVEASSPGTGGTVSGNTESEIPAVGDGVTREYVENEKIKFEVNLQNGDIDGLDSAFDIVNVGGTYYLQEIYKVGTFKLGNQIYNTLAAYNKSFMASNNNEVTIPGSVVTSYGQFEFDMEEVQKIYMDPATHIPNTDADALQERYNKLYPSNIIRAGDPDTGEGAVYDIDIRNEDLAAEPLATNVKKVVLDIYACQQQGAVASGKADAPCRAQEVAMIQEGADDKIVYVAYNPVKGEFYADKTRTLRAIADDAFGKNAYPGDSNVIQLNKLVLPDTIAYIGNNSFEGCSGIRSFELTGTVTNIGCQAFKGCTSMQSIKINNLQKIGAEAFADCNSLGSITFPSTLDEIGQGAFYNCTSLKTVDMSQITGGVIIDDFAFYDCTDLNSFNFGSTVSSIGKGCFAVTDNKPINGSWTKIQLADSASELGDAMFDGRTNIEEVIFPSTYGAVPNSARTSILDDNFFRRCSALKSVTIPGAYASFGVDVFQSVESDQFYVEGPATYRADADYTLEENYANPRVSAHNARITYKFKYGNEEFFDVAYNYQPSDNDGNPVVDADGNPVKVTDYYLINVATGELEKYTPDPDNNYSTKIVIKANYNGVSVTGIAEGCFDSVKETATELIVEDGTISLIGKNAFKGFVRLQKVHLGNSVKEIGDGAFAGCNLLEDVYFNMDEVKIGNEAFQKDVTASPTGLTFHGKIEAGFEPYDWAMKPENELSTAGLRILYMNLPPSNLGTIYDRTSEGENISVPLIFYPIYNYLDADNEDYRKTKAEQLGLGNWEDYSIIKRVEAGAAGDNQDGDYADADDLAYANATKHIVIPAGVTSIDTPKYYGSAENNTNVTTYVQYSEGPGKVTNSREAIRYASLTNVVDDHTVVPGLFSGWYEDYVPGTDEASEYEKEVKGNDRVESITMFTVESIPDYAFDSCERLQKVDLGAGCKKIGLAPFRGCTSLVEVIGNETIICENDILYTTNEDGSYTLVECLPSRGKNGNAEVSVANDPKLANVSKISESAFIDCKNLVSVNLSGCNYITTIPKDCFKGCYSLRNVVFPGSVNNIAEGAFKGLTQIHVTIPSKEVYIHRDAFEHGNGENGTSVGEKLSTVVIQSFPDSAAFRYTEDNYIGFEGYNEDEHSVTFLNWDFSELYRTRVKDGASVRPFLETQTEPSRSGYKFVGWATITNGATLDVITADTIFIAQFNSKGGNNGNGNGNVSGNGSGNGNGNGSGDGNGNGSKMHTVTVINGSGSGSYIEGADVVIAANNPPTGYQFKDWTVNTNNATLASNRVAATTFKMPAGDVRVTANYEKSKSSGSSVSGNGSGGSSSSNKNNNNNSGTKVVITRPGISDTDLASAKVNGSKDGFIVKISETAEATAAVEQALTNKYGSLDNIRYAAMDISLYDSTGTNKITDTTGYTIDITIPIPDVLREYAGNNKTAAVVNAQLENLAPKFTTIDGVPCVTFRATHFSPYTVYVDTGNLTVGGLDSTPKTGDGIHPKWFLAIGLACLSVVMFMKKDKKAPKVKTA